MQSKIIAEQTPVADDKNHFVPGSNCATDIIGQAKRIGARQALAKVQSGGDGPWIPEASFVAVEKEVHPIGAIFITLLPDTDPSDWDSYHWREPPPQHWREQVLGRPHLTWVFVSPWHLGHGTGTALLGAAVAALRGIGYRRLASTFLVGNDSSMLWHWRNGFELQAYPGSRRRWDQQFPRLES